MMMSFSLELVTPPACYVVDYNHLSMPSTGSLEQVTPSLTHSNMLSPYSLKLVTSPLG